MDKWSLDQAARMKSQGYTDDVIINHLVAYGLRFNVSRGIVLMLREGKNAQMPQVAKTGQNGLESQIALDSPHAQATS